MDDILIHGETRARHDEHYENVLRAIRASGLKLNKDKCLLRQSKLVFMGNLISKADLEPDPEKVDAICKMSAPENVTETWSPGETVHGTTILSRADVTRHDPKEQTTSTTCP